jgi:hypothetical protein
MTGDRNAENMAPPWWMPLSLWSSLHDPRKGLNGWAAVLFGGTWQNVPWWREGANGWHICDYSVLDGAWPHKCEPLRIWKPWHLAVMAHSWLVGRINF